MIYELIDLTDWKKAKDCVSELNQGGIRIDEKQLKQLVIVNNINFKNQDTDIYIASSRKGYMAIKDRNEILSTLRTGELND